MKNYEKNDICQTFWFIFQKIEITKFNDNLTLLRIFFIYFITFKSCFYLNPLVATGSPGTRENDDFLDTLIIDLTFRALAP